jgi:hypothetical protein
MSRSRCLLRGVRQEDSVDFVVDQVVLDLLCNYCQRIMLLILEGTVLSRLSNGGAQCTIDSRFTMALCG